MGILNQVNEFFVDRVNGKEIRIVEIGFSPDSEPLITYEYLLNGRSESLEKEAFEYHFKPRHEKSKKTKKNVNQDILKLIKAGYEFSSFWGDTVDGRSINVDLNEEEVK